jgi:hypothetical protein
MSEIGYLEHSSIITVLNRNTPQKCTRTRDKYQGKT